MLHNFDCAKCVTRAAYSAVPYLFVVKWIPYSLRSPTSNRVLRKSQPHVVFSENISARLCMGKSTGWTFGKWNIAASRSSRLRIRPVPFLLQPSDVSSLNCNSDLLEWYEWPKIIVIQACIQLQVIKLLKVISRNLTFTCSLILSFDWTCKPTNSYLAYDQSAHSHDVIKSCRAEKTVKQKSHYVRTHLIEQFL